MIYQYTKSPVALDRLTIEINNSYIVTSLDYISMLGNLLSIHFKDSLSVEDKTILDDIIIRHSGIPMPENTVSKVEVTAAAANSPFSAKMINGYKLFRRKHGVKAVIAANNSGELTITVPYNICKINKIEIVGTSVGDTANLSVYDSDTGFISKVPNSKLNQFGFDVVLPNNYYEDASDYDADLFKGMVIKVTVNNSSNVDKLYGVNFTLHELK